MWGMIAVAARLEPGMSPHPVHAHPGDVHTLAKCLHHHKHPHMLTMLDPHAPLTCLLCPAGPDLHAHVDPLPCPPCPPGPDPLAHQAPPPDLQALPCMPPRPLPSRP